VASAVMLQARLQKGMRLMDVIQLTHSLGERLAAPSPSPSPSPAQAGGQAETFRWTDASGAAVTVLLHKGRVSDWSFSRPAAAAAAGGT
jgi:hypothetical protein